MARADLLINLVKGGAEGDATLFRKALEAMIAEERAKQHHVLADRLAAHLRVGDRPPSRAIAPVNGEARLVHEVRPERRLDELQLPDGVAGACRELIEEHHRGDLLRSHNLEPRHRVLLVGPPGNGKTSLAEALATELVVPLLVVRYGSLIGSYLGETAVRLAKLFAAARTQRCVLFFDQFPPGPRTRQPGGAPKARGVQSDVIGKERGDIHETGEIKRVVSSLLVQIDKLPSHVVVVTATNHGELLDRAAWRRFQLRLELPRPTKGQRMAWFRNFEARSGLELAYTHDHLARRLAGLSYAELEQFTLDVQRRYVLTMPNGTPRRMGHWRAGPRRKKADPAVDFS